MDPKRRLFNEKYEPASDGSDRLFETVYEPATESGRVECLGLTFDSEDARRQHYLTLLRQGLEELHARLGGVPFTTAADAVAAMQAIEYWPMGDEERLWDLARRMEDAHRGQRDKDLLQLWKDEIGFPHGEIEDILALSDPPYYTACPNPFLNDFIEHYGKLYVPEQDSYHKEPFAVDVAEGRHTWLYKAHTYHTKVPPNAIKRFIEHYSEPGDIILDGFSGSGMTGVAGMMAEPSRSVFACDLSPAASFITSEYLSQVDISQYQKEALRIIKLLDNELGWMYLPNSELSPKLINYYVWSDVFLCNSCGAEIVFWDAAYDPQSKKFSDTFKCPVCGATNSKASSQRAKETLFDPILQVAWSRYKQVPVLAAEPTSGRRAHKRKANESDYELLARVRNAPLPQGAYRLAVKMLLRDGQWGDQWKNCLHLRPVTHVHQLFAKRQLHYIGRFLDLLDLNRPEHRALLFTATSVLQKTSRLMVYNADGIGRVQKGTLYISSVWQEMRFTHMLQIAVTDMIRAAKEGMWTSLPQKGVEDNTFQVAWAGSSTALPIDKNTVDYIFIDPPFGANIPYSEVNFLWESMLGVFTNTKPDAVESKIQKKRLIDYQRLMEQCFSEFRRVLKPKRWITIEFHNSKNSVWNSIQEALMRAGFVVADVRVLDKKQKSFKQATTAGAVKKDLIITAYKPSSVLEKRFQLEAGTVEGAWTFISDHLKQLPIFVATSDNKAEIIVERQAHMLYDRMVAFHVLRGISVPLSAAEFYAGLHQRFPERNEMYFLPEQITKYDKMRLKVQEVEQLPLFITDESSAIRWLRQELTNKPQTVGELKPQFMQEIGGWQKNEVMLELDELLKQNFLMYDGEGEVPSQIHSYLSSNYKELRNLAKDDPRLRAKAKDRWYVPDPNKAADLEKVRERALLREFERYKERSGKFKRNEKFRMEAIRAGFKKAWQERDYQTIINVAEKLPPDRLQEDPKLLMWYDQALTRLGGQ